MFYNENALLKINPSIDDAEIITFEELAEEFLLYKKPEIKESTYFRYYEAIHSYMIPIFGKCTLGELKEYDFNRYTMYLMNNNYAGHFVRDLIVLLKGILKYAVLKYDINYKLQLINLPRFDVKEPKIFTYREQSKIIRKCLKSDDIRSIAIALVLMTGLRIGEICSLKWDDIDLVKKEIHVVRTIQRVKQENGGTRLLISIPKTKHSIRFIPLVDMLVQKIKRIDKGDNEFFVVNSKGKLIEPRAMQVYYYRILNECKIERRNFHVLRHTFATNCINVGMDAKSLSEILGHSDVTITLARYVHSDGRIKRRYMEKYAKNFEIFD